MKKLKILVVLVFLIPISIISQEMPVQPRHQNDQNNKINEGLWQELKSNQGKFWVLLPGQAVEKIEPVQTIVGEISMPGSSIFKSEPTSTAVGNVDFNMHVFDEGNVAWFATYSDYPKSHTDTDFKLIITI